MSKFKPGQSGNPGGRPRVIAEIQSLARQHTADAIETLATIMKDGRASAPARVSAAMALLDRGYGKPVQTIDNLQKSARELSDQELLAIIAAGEGEANDDA
jgi:hypothetical protein